MLLVYSAAAFLAGIVTASFAYLPPGVWALWLALPLVSLFLLRDQILRRANVCALAFLLGAARYSIANPWDDPNSLASFNDRGAITITGSIAAPPEVRDRATQLRVSVRHVVIAGIPRPMSSDALVLVPRETAVQYGDVIEFTGAPTTPFETMDFSYKDYLARQGIHSLVRVSGDLRVLERGTGNFFFTWLYALRERAFQTILLIFPEPAASLLSGILLGIDSGIPNDLSNAFAATNTAHIVAISGFNVSIIAGILSQLARRFFTPRHTMLIVIAGLLVYTFLAGASASVVRAAIMGSLAMIALYYNRQNYTLNALFAAALVMCALNPYTLWDVGFQLSFLATLGLVLYSDRLTRWFENLVSRATADERAKKITGVVSDSLMVTLAAQITTTPLIIFIFHRLSLIGLVTNFFVLPVQPPLMILGGIATILGMLFQPLGQAVAWLAWVFLEWTIVIVEWTASLPYAAIEIGKLDALVLAGYYLILFGLTRPNLGALRQRFSISPTLVAGAAMVAGVWLWNVYTTLPDGKMRVVFIDAGSPATFVQTPRGSKILIDGGQNPSAVLSILGQRMPFWDRQIDLMVLTSVDDDHLAGLVEALERYEVRQIVQAEMPLKPLVAASRWDEVIAQKRVPCALAQNGLQIALDEGVTLEWLAPLPEAKPPRAAVLRLRAGQITFLFAEGASIEDQAALLKANADLGSTLLIAPRKIAPEFFSAVSPANVILFTNSSARKPSADLLAALAGATVLQTGNRGTVEVIVDGQTVSVRTAR